MPAYFVWSKPSLVVVIEAASEQDAAEAFMDLPMTATPERGVSPDCFVESALGRDAPQLAAVAKFWVAVDGDPT